jgi:hypothetical protein
MKEKLNTNDKDYQEFAKVIKNLADEEQPVEEQDSETGKDEKQDEAPKEEPKPRKKLKPYVHINDFLSSAKHVYSLNSMQVSGFKAYMAGEHYQRGEAVFRERLEQYLGKTK